MCTVILHVPDRPGGPIRVLAVRDEDPARAWDPPGPWWPDTHPGVIGVRDARAGGAWLAVDGAAGRLAVILNRRDVPGATASRGAVVLDAVAGRAPGEVRTNGFNLVVVEGSGARVYAWEGGMLRETPLPPGVHMIAHDEVDDDATPRIARWLPEFRGADAGAWPGTWLDVLTRSAVLDSADDAAIVRDNRAHGISTLSLLVCTAEVSPGAVELAWAALDEPGRWTAPPLHPAPPR